MARVPKSNDSPSAPKLSGRSGDEPGPAVPPKPVRGAPRGITATVVVVAGTVVVVGGAARQVGTVTVLVSSVTAPLRASTRPLTDAPVFRVADCSAITEPAN